VQNTQLKPGTAKTGPKRRRGNSLERKKARAGWIFIFPFAAGFVTIYLPVIINSIWLSFNKIKIGSTGGFTLEWMGLGNYQEALFEDTAFVQTLYNTVWKLIMDIPSIIIFALFIAIILNQKMVGRAAFRAIFFVPVILATGIIDRIDTANTMLQFMGSEGSIQTTATGSAANTVEIVTAMDFQWLFRNMMVGQGMVTYVVNAVNNIYAIVNRSGVQMLIFLAGLQSIPPTVYEASYIEGASAWETFWKITFPMISPMILVNAVYTVIDSFTSQSNAVMIAINNRYTQSGGNVVSAAMSWVYFLLVMVLIAVVAGLVSAFVFYQRRD